jgi:hypothetical protein
VQPTQPKSGMTRVVSRCQKCGTIDEFDIVTADDGTLESEPMMGSTSTPAFPTSRGT